MAKTKNRWQDLDVRRWAEYFTSHPRITLMFLENRIGVSHSTLWWCFRHRLEAICPRLYQAAIQQLQNNKNNKRRCA